MKRCSRLQAQLTALFSMKHNGMTRFEWSQILLKILTLLSATVEEKSLDGQTDSTGEEDLARSVSSMVIDAGKAGSKRPGKRKKATLRFEDVGCILGGSFGEEEEKDSMLVVRSDGTRAIRMEFTRDESLEKDLSLPFALPCPAREALLSVALLLLSKKGALRAASNSALFASSSEDDKPSERWLLLLDWRSLLRMLLRTAPYLDERKAGTHPTNSSSRQSAVLKRTVNLIRSSRRFFDQGIRPPGWTGPTVETDAAARALWDAVQNDLLYRTHSNSCFRALILLYLFHPSRCSSEFYSDVMPRWMESWTNVDRCPEFDFLWMVMFCRARKRVSPDEYDWGALRRSLLTRCGYW